MSRPLLLHGRLPDPRRVDEVVVNRRAASQFHLHVGQRVTLVSATDLNAFFGTAPMSGGPTVRATIVGIGDSAMDQVFTPDEPSFFPSGGFLTRHPEVPRAANLVVRLEPGTNVTRFHRRAAAVMNLPDIPVRDLAEDRKRVTHSTDLERTALLLFAAAVVLAGVVLVGQALTRTVYSMAEPVGALRALGFTRPDMVRGLVSPMVITAVTASVVAIGSAVALSARFPVGLARRLEPDHGVHADWGVLASGAAALVLLVVAAATLAAYRAARAVERAPAPGVGSPLLRAVRRARPLPVAIGAGLALEPGRGDRSLPVRPAIAGAVAGILGIVGALGLVHGIDDALAQPRRSGQVWDATVWPDDTHPRPALVTALRGDPRVDQIAKLQRMPVDVQGAGLPVYSLDPVRGHLSFVVLHGRAPAGSDEAAIGLASAKALHKQIGDRLQVGGQDGVNLRIVGTALLEQTPHTSFDQGVWATPAIVDKLAIPAADQQEQVFAVTGRRGIKAAPLIAHLHKRLGNVEIDSISSPQDVLALRNVRTLPVALAGFLAVLGLAALGHALVTAVRRRRHDLAVLRAIGFRPRQNAACIAWQAMAVAVVGLVVGIPLGIAAGRLSWRWVADRTPLIYAPPLAAAAVVIAVPAAILLAKALAALPARRAARLRPAEVLRTE